MNTPQTTKEFQTNYRKLVRSTTKMLLAYEKAALESGAFSLDEARGSFDLPKNTITAALKEVACQWAPREWDSSRKDRSMVRNIQRMTYPEWSGL